MKILAAFAGKSGTAEGGATLFASLLPNHQVTVANLNETTPVPGDFDYILLGGSIRMGKAHKALRRYLKDHDEALCAIPHTLFLCCGIPEQFGNYLVRTFSENLLESADDTAYFGGELDVSKQKGFDKLVARMIRNSIRESEDDEAGLPGFLPEHVRMVADRVKPLKKT